MKRPRRRRLPVVWIAVVLVAGVAVNVALALRPRVLESHVAAALDAVFLVPVSYGAIDVAWTGGVEISDFRVHGRSPASADLAAIETVHIVPDLGAALRGEYRIAEIVLSNADFRVEPAAGELWSWTDAIELPPHDWTRALPRVRVEKGRLLVAGAVGDERVHAIELADASFRLDPHQTRREGGAMKLAAFESSARLPFAGFASVHGELGVDGSKPSGSVTVRLSRIDLARPEIAAFIPEPFRERYRALEPGGFADVALDIELGPEGIELRRGELALAGGRATTPLSIGGIRGLRGRASVDERGEIQGSFAGEWGDGISRIDLAATLAPDRRSLASVEGEVKLDGLTIDGALASRCHPILARLIRELGLAGRARLEISLPRTGSFPPDLDAIVARAELESAELQPQWFPYVFRGDHLRATYEGGIVRIEPGFELRAGQGTISIGRAFFEPSSAGLVDVEIGVHDLAVDARLLRAAPESARAILESLDPSGRASATILVRRLRGGGDAERSDSQGELATGSRTDASASLPRILVEARVADGRVRYREFPYPVDSISGEVLFDSETGELGFRSFRGQHGATEIEFTGRAACYAHEMDLVFSSRNLAVDDGLLAALPASYRHLLTDFGFRGNVAAEARIARAGTDPETANTLGISASIIDATFEHRLFPYPVPLASGRVEISSGSEVRIADLRTPEDHDPHLEFDGVFRMESPKPTFDFRLALDGLAVDERLKRALPDALRRLSDAIRLEGTFQGKAEGHLEIDPDDPRQSALEYRVTDVRTRDAGVDFGLAVTGMRAVGELVGRAGPGDVHVLSGDLYIQQAEFNRLDLQGGHLHYRLGELHPLIHGIIERTENLPPASYEVPREIRDELLARPVDRLLQVSVTSESFYGGQANGFLYVDTRDGQGFGGHLVGRNIEVALASEDVFGHSGDGVRGEAEGEVRFAGRTGDPKSVTGRGRGAIRDANLATVPLFYQILELLNLGSKGGVFRELSIPYEIADGRFRSSAIEIASGIVTLRGRGTLSFDGELLLGLEPEFIPLRLPVVDRVLNVFKRVLSQVQVEGPLSDPRVSLRLVGAEIPLGGGSGESRHGEES